MLFKRFKLVAGLTLLAASCLGTSLAHASPRLQDICRVKGQEENSLRGLGLVIGLKGTGDGGEFQPMIRSLAMAMQLMGNAIGQGDLSEAKNVALVMVTATIPAEGARQGDKIDCHVSSIGSAKSLAGGRLFVAPLQGPQIDSPRVYAFAEGPLQIEDAQFPTTAKIDRGCRLEEDFFNVFTQDETITLVIDKNHGGFQIAQDIADLINEQLGPQVSTGGAYSAGQTGLKLVQPAGLRRSNATLARALNQINVEVGIPQQYRDDPVLFVAQVLNLRVRETQTVSRVVINERTGAIAIDGDVEISATVLTHKNVAVETGAAAGADRFFGVDTASPTNPKLDDLVKTLSAVKVPADDIIEIIRVLDRTGNLHGQLIIE